MSHESQRERTAFARLMRFWRTATELSQVQLAESLKTSTRHVSFLETGRSNPSRSMAQRLAQVFDLGDRDRDVLLMAAGFVPEAEELDLAQPQFRYLRDQLHLLLHSHEPYPAFVVDNLGDMVMCNRAWVRMLDHFAEWPRTIAPNNMYHLYFSDEGLRRVILNWEGLACTLLKAVQEQQLLTGDERLEELMTWLASYPGIPEDWARQGRQWNRHSEYQIKLRFQDSDYHSKTIITGIDPVRRVSGTQLFLHSFYPGNELMDKAWHTFRESVVVDEGFELLCRGEAI